MARARDGAGGGAGGEILAVSNQKGGVGKTTTAVNLAACLAQRGARVLLVDLDPQANATSALGLRAAPSQATAYRVLLGLVPASRAVVAARPGLDLVPSSRDLGAAEVELAGQRKPQFFLGRALEAVAGSYDLVLVDCPPTLGLLTVNALVAAHGVLVPVQCEYLALEGLSYLFETLQTVRTGLNPRLALEGIVLTMYDGRARLAQDVAREVRGRFPAAYQTLVARSVRLAEAPGFGQTIIEYDPAGRAAQAYRDLAEEFLARRPQLAARLGPAPAGAKP